MGNGEQQQKSGGFRWFDRVAASVASVLLVAVAAWVWNTQGQMYTKQDAEKDWASHGATHMRTEHPSKEYREVMDTRFKALDEKLDDVREQLKRIERKLDNHDRGR